MEVKPVFIIGPPRTGTTLVSFLLGGGEGTLSLSEPFHAHAIMPHWAQHRFFCRLQKSAGLNHVRPPRRFHRQRFQVFLRDLAAHNGLPFLIIKETFHHRRLKPPWCNFELLDGFASEQDPIIGVVRHPYDTAASTVRLLRRLVFGPSGWLVRRLFRNVPRFVDNTDIVRWSAENYLHFAGWVRQRHLFVVRYEDLVSEPGPQLRRICDYSGVPFDERMLDHRHPRTAFGGIGSPEVLYRPPQPVNRKSVGRGKQLTDEHRDILRKVCAPCAAELGYPL